MNGKINLFTSVLTISRRFWVAQLPTLWWIHTEHVQRDRNESHERERKKDSAQAMIDFWPQSSFKVSHSKKGLRARAPERDTIARESSQTSRVPKGWLTQVRAAANIGKSLKIDLAALTDYHFGQIFTVSWMCLAAFARDRFAFSLHSWSGWGQQLDIRY